MRVGLSMLTLVPGVSGGSETYARGLARALARRGNLDVTAFVPALAPDAGEGLPTEVVSEYHAARGGAARAWALARATTFPGPLRRRYAGLDVVHFPFTVPVPRVTARTVVTLHDVQHLDLPELFGAGTRAFRRVAYDRAARRADLVVVPSEFVRERALERLSLDPSRVRAIHLGVDHDLFRPGEEEREPFVLYPARPWPHKNHARLLEAFALLRVRHGELRLVLTGAGTEALAGPAGIEARGSVPLPELASLYRRASCLVFPSRYEGFGSPPLEAMACGTPVAAARAGSIPEVCGEAAVLFDPDDAEAIAEGVETALARSAELREKGTVHAAAFTWANTARAHERVYDALGAGSTT
jgi:glycosyltransferase involved in cell wall biosynthesis